MRAVFRLTSSIWIELSGRKTAAHARNAAEDGSPGTSTSPAWGWAGPVTLAVQAPAVVATPYSGSMSSVWLRLGAGSLTVVVPEARWQVYLVASIDERVERRFRQYETQGVPMDRETLRRDVVEFEGDGKVLLRRTLNTDLDVRDVWVHIRRRARKIEGCTAIRFNGALYTL